MNPIAIDAEELTKAKARIVELEAALAYSQDDARTLRNMLVDLPDKPRLKREDLADLAVAAKEMLHLIKATDGPWITRWEAAISAAEGGEE